MHIAPFLTAINEITYLLRKKCKLDLALWSQRYNRSTWENLPYLNNLFVLHKEYKSILDSDQDSVWYFGWCSQADPDQSLTFLCFSSTKMLFSWVQGDPWSLKLSGTKPGMWYFQSVVRSQGTHLPSSCIAKRLGAMLRKWLKCSSVPPETGICLRKWSVLSQFWTLKSI